jgi:hypothetical protein
LLLAVVALEELMLLADHKAAAVLVDFVLL